MSKKLIFALAFAFMLVSGAFMNVHAATLSGPYFSQPSTVQVSNLAVPVHMGTIGY